MTPHRFVVQVRVDEISAAHRLDGYAGDCARLHGHNWSFEATVGADELHADMVVDFVALKSVFKALDHRLLNDLELCAGGRRPTAERLAQWLAERVQSLLDAQPNRPRLLSLTVVETSRNRVVYTPPR